MDGLGLDDDDSDEDDDDDDEDDEDDAEEMEEGMNFGEEVCGWYVIWLHE